MNRQPTDGHRLLEQAGLIQIDKTFEAKRARTWIRATAAGRRAYRSEVETLRALIERSDNADA